MLQLGANSMIFCCETSYGDDGVNDNILKSVVTNEDFNACITFFVRILESKESNGCNFDKVGISAEGIFGILRIW